MPGASVTRRDICCLLPLASGHQQPSQLSVSRPMAVAGCAALRSSPQSISGPPSLRSPAAKWRQNPPPGADRHHRPSTCTTATQSMYVKLGARCRCRLHNERLTFVPARARQRSADPQPGAAPPARLQQLQTAEVTTCHGDRCGAHLCLRRSRWRCVNNRS